MELLFATLIGIALGLAVSFFTPGRDTYGVLLVPAVAGCATSAVWVALVWLGWTFDGTWIWVASLAAGALSALAVSLLLPRRRRAEDEHMLSTLAG
jgi:hypothetical protein